MTTDHARADEPTAPGPMPRALLRWAALPGCQQILAGARSRLEAGHVGDRTRVPADLDAAARRDVGRLLGLTWQTSGRPVTLGSLRAAVTRAGGDLSDLLVATGGPLRDRPAERVELRDAQERRREQARALLRGAGQADAVVDLLLRRRWLGGADTDALPEQAGQLATLLHALPAAGTLLATLASDLYQDPHALDRDTTLGRAASRVLAAQAVAGKGASDGEVAAAADACSSAAGWRSAWASVGVVCDQVSSTVLVLNLPLAGIGAAGALLRAGTAEAEPVWLTARSLAHVGELEAGSLAGWTVRVCENPSVVEAAADRLGAACPPLVCTYGRPSTAAWLLLRALARGGARLLVSADRDSVGDDIVRDLMTGLPGAGPWLADVPGLYEEDRLSALLHDLQAHLG